MNKRSRFNISGSHVFLAIFFSSYGACGQIPKLFLKFVARQNQVKSGDVKMQYINMTDQDTVRLIVKKSFFISTPKDLKYLTWYHAFNTQSSDTVVYYARIWSLTTHVYGRLLRTYVVTYCTRMWSPTTHVSRQKQMRMWKKSREK
jgi:hypothetical protein